MYTLLFLPTSVEANEAGVVAPGTGAVGYRNGEQSGSRLVMTQNGIQSLKMAEKTFN